MGDSCEIALECSSFLQKAVQICAASYAAWWAVGCGANPGSVGYSVHLGSLQSMPLHKFSGWTNYVKVVLELFLQRIMGSSLDTDISSDVLAGAAGWLCTTHCGLSTSHYRFQDSICSKFFKFENDLSWSASLVLRAQQIFRYKGGC